MGTPEEGARSFLVTLAALEDGQLAADLTAKQHDLAKKLAAGAAVAGRAKGSLSLRLTLNVDAGGTVQIDGEIVVKEPKTLRSRTVMWLSKGDNLVAENPKQIRLPLREVPAPGPARDVPAAHDAPRSV